jgi:hypothetical protein
VEAGGWISPSVVEVLLAEVLAPASVPGGEERDLEDGSRSRIWRSHDLPSGAGEGKIGEIFISRALHLRQSTLFFLALLYDTWARQGIGARAELSKFCFGQALPAVQWQRGERWTRSQRGLPAEGSK